MSYKFTQANWQQWKSSPEQWWKEQGIKLSPEQVKWLKSQNWSNWTYDEFKERIQKSRLFAGIFDWS